MTHTERLHLSLAISHGLDKSAGVLGAIGKGVGLLASKAPMLGSMAAKTVRTGANALRTGASILGGKNTVRLAGQMGPHTMADAARVANPGFMDRAVTELTGLGSTSSKAIRGAEQTMLGNQRYGSMFASRAIPKALGFAAASAPVAMLDHEGARVSGMQEGGEIAAAQFADKAQNMGIGERLGFLMNPSGIDKMLPPQVLERLRAIQAQRGQQ